MPSSKFSCRLVFCFRLSTGYWDLTCPKRANGVYISTGTGSNFSNTKDICEESVLVMMKKMEDLEDFPSRAQKQQISDQGGPGSKSLT